MLRPIVLSIAGILCLGYYGCLCVYLRKWDSTFSRFWLLSGMGFLILCFLERKGYVPEAFWLLFYVVPVSYTHLGFTGRKVKGTIHWVAAPYAKQAEVRLYENLIDEEKGVYNEEDGSMNLNPNSLEIRKNCFVEPNFEDAKAYDSFQFVRNGYFCIDAKDSTPENLVFNRIVSLKSSFKLPKK